MYRPSTAEEPPAAPSPAAPAAPADEAGAEGADEGAGAGAGAGGAGSPGHAEQLLAVCRYWDRECAGYLLDEDLEEIAYMVSEDLSRECALLPLLGPLPMEREGD